MALECLQETYLKEQRLVDGKLFPLVFKPSLENQTISLESSQQELASSPLHVFNQNREFIEHKLDEHGALFFRGFPLHSASDFNSILEGFGWRNMPYVGSAPRTRILGSVYTASDANPNVSIPFHHEMSQITKNWPHKVLFFCETPPLEGGQTPIVVSHKVAEQMWLEFPKFMQKVEELKMLYIKILPMEKDPSQVSSQGWPIVFGTYDHEEASKRAAEYFNAKVQWLSDGRMKMVSGPFKATRNFGRLKGKDCWFNQMIVYHSGQSSNLEMPPHVSYDVVFGDGSPLPIDVVERCRRIHDENSVDIPWQEGDMMIVDNLAVMHGRRAYKAPRKILVSLCE